METNNHLKIGKPPRPMLFLVLFFLLGWGLGSCGGVYLKFSTPDIPPAPCPIQELLLDVSAFPDYDWEETGSRSERGAPVRMGVERIGTAYSTTNGGALQDVYRIGYESEARKAYKDSTKSWFTPAEDRTEWATPEKLNNLTVSADLYRAGCNNRKLGDLEECQYVAQYGPYVIRFFAHMHALSYEDFIELVKEIDHQATSCLRQWRDDE